MSPLKDFIEYLLETFDPLISIPLILFIIGAYLVITRIDWEEIISDVITKPQDFPLSDKQLDTINKKLQEFWKICQEANRYSDFYFDYYLPIKRIEVVTEKWEGYDPEEPFYADRIPGIEGSAWVRGIIRKSKFNARNLVKLLWACTEKVSEPIQTIEKSITTDFGYIVADCFEKAIRVALVDDLIKFLPLNHGVAYAWQRERKGLINSNLVREQYKQMPCLQQEIERKDIKVSELTNREKYATLHALGILDPGS